LTGVILAVVGAGFILGKIREKPTEITGKTEMWHFTIASTSPGLIMVTLGTVLMVSAILTHHEIGVVDRPLYLGTLDSIVVAQERNIPTESGLGSSIDAIRKRREQSSAAESTKTKQRSGGPTVHRR